MERTFSVIYYKFKLSFNNVQFKRLPRINGRLELKNEGKLILGNNLTFNSNFYSNPMGLNKCCSIFVESGGTLEIGDNSGFSGVAIYCSSTIQIGDNLYCGGNVSIWDTDFHPLSSTDRVNNIPGKTRCKPIYIGDNVFIGANSLILKGANIGNCSIIGAGSVVTRSVPPNEIWGGNPASFIKKVT